MDGLLIIIGVFTGFYLAKFSEINFRFFKKFQKKEIGEPFVVATDEAKLEREQNAKQVEEEIINVKDFIK